MKPMERREWLGVLLAVVLVVCAVGVARGQDSAWKIVPPENGQVVAEVCDHKWRTWWAYAMVCEAPDCPELNPPTMRLHRHKTLRLEWCERCGILRMPEARRKMGREVKE